jgi:hypothetical protein
VRRDRALDEAQQPVDREREHHGHDRRCDHSDEPVARLVENYVAQPSAARYRCERRGRDDVDGRRADAGEDERPGQRQLHHRQDLALVHAHPAGGVDGVRVDPVDGGVGVGEDRRDGEGDERDLDVDHAQAQQSEADRDQRQAGERPERVGHVDRNVGAAMAVAQPDAERQGEGEGEGDGDGAQAHVRERL